MYKYSIFTKRVLYVNNDLSHLLNILVKNLGK